MSEITWSLMHPTSLDVKYMRRVVDKSAEYDVDSFEICGAFASPLGGMNGLLLLEPYPTAHRLADKDAIMKNRETLRNIVDLAHGAGKKLYYWHREIMIPVGVLDDAPEMMDRNGEFDLLGDCFQNFLRYKLAETFRVVPELDGLVLTLTEADFSVIHNSSPEQYPPHRVVAEIVRIFAEEHRKRGKRFILRSFGSIAEDYEDILAGATIAAQEYNFDIETKITPYDFVPFLSCNPFLRKLPNTELNAECDSLGEFLGAGYLPAANLDNIERYVREGRSREVSRYAIRLDRIGNSIFDSHEINLYGYHRLIRDPQVTAEDIWREWAARHWPECPAEMIELGKAGLECVKKINYVHRNVIFHKFPVLAEFKWIKAGGIFGVFPNDVPLKYLAGIWSIQSGDQSPGREAIRREKDQALAMAHEGLRKVQELRPKLGDAEYRKTERVWRHAVIAATAIRAFVYGICAYFDDMGKHLQTPHALAAAIDNADQAIVPLMRDPNGGLPTMASCCDGAPCPGDDLDRVYLKPLHHLCHELLNEYQAEWTLRNQTSQQKDIVDSVFPGTITDDWRVYRYMHACHAELSNGVPARYAGNTVFPNGFIEVVLKNEGGGILEIQAIPGSSQECKLTVNGVSTIQSFDNTGRCSPACPQAKEVTVRIEKYGREYPAISRIALLKS